MKILQRLTSKHLLAVFLISTLLFQSSCATLFCGEIGDCQKRKPAKGQPTRAIRGGAFICDIVFSLVIFCPLTLGIDFITRAIYRPCENAPVNNGSLTPIANNPVVNNAKDTVQVNSDKSTTQAVQNNPKVDHTPTKGTKAYLDYKNGFRDMKFETELPQDGTMVLIGDTIKGNHSAGMKFYSRTSDKLTIGDYQLQSIIYGYYKGRLDYIQIDTKGYINSRGILAMLQDLFGNGFKDNEYIEEYAWFGSKVTLLYDENSISNDARTFFSDKKLDEQQKYDEKQMQKKAESGF